MPLHRRTMRRHILWASASLIALGLVAAPASAEPPRQDASHIAYNQTAEGRITESVSQQEWTFAARAGDAILIDMRAADGSTLDTFLTLLDPTGNTIMSDDDGGEELNARVGPVAIDQDGIYTIIASSYNGIGNYTLALTDLNTVPVLRVSKPLVGTVDASHPTDVFRLVPMPDGANPLVRLALTDDNAYDDPFIAVHGESGFIAGTEEELLPALDPIALLPGRSYVAVISWNPDSPGGAYQIALEPSAIELVRDGVAQRGSLDYSTISQQHYFMAQRDDVIRVTIAAEGNIAPAVEILSADFTLFLFTNDGEYVRGVTAEVTIPESGIYVVSVTDGTYLGESGTYALRLDWLAE